MELLDKLIIGFITILTLVYAIFKYSHRYWKSRGVAYIEPTIPFGNAKGLGVNVSMSQFSKRVYDELKPTGAKVGGAYIFCRPIAVLIDLEIIKNVLVKDFARFNDRGIYYNKEDDPLSAHLFSLDGNQWKKLRAKLTPTFTSGKMKFMFPTFLEVGEHFHDCLKEMVGQQDELEIKDLCARFTTDIIGSCAFGIECNSLKDPQAEFRHYGRKLIAEPRHNSLQEALKRQFRSFARTLHMKSIADDVAEFFMRIVHETVEYRERNNICRNDFMDILINLKNQTATDKEKLTMNEIAAQAFVFYLAGFETASSTLTFCLYELAMNPEVQSKARQTIRDALARHNGQITYEMMMDMPYIDQVIQETLRKYPSLGTLNRLAKNDYAVPGTKIVIEKGTLIFIPINAIQRDPEYFPDPEKFDPDRFSSEQKNCRNPLTWLPFGDGPRNCIGLRFGMMQTRVGLVTMLKNFELSLGPSTQVPLVFVAKTIFTTPKHGIYLKLKPTA